MSIQSFGTFEILEVYISPRYLGPPEIYFWALTTRFYKNVVTRNPASVNVTCKVCTPAQTVELTCYICDTTKGLEGFAKNQRKDPDRARCLKCVNKVLETEPDLTPPASSDEEDEEEDTDDVCRDPNICVFSPVADCLGVP